ncbi:hypothetical protein [Streptomyces sp. NBC_01794]|uniref:hypothetical protein n=1 Tax=Streptomyces sp. NBC_01794 TaxID=2975942 RepID=UPI003084BC9D|nr:hypothetical protein OIE54_22780 [Streptomyces sp. NBC_01794]
MAMVGVIKSATTPIDLDGTGISVAEAAMTGGIGMTLIIVDYSNLASAYTAWREALSLKRLRTGEVSDPEILAGIALPAVVLALAQCGLMVAAGAALLHLKVPQRPELLVAGALLGRPVSTAGSRTVTAVS